MIEPDVLERTLATALRGGGDFAEVFAEDRRATNARLDDGRVEELVSGRERGAGVRVVRGETTGYAHTADLSERGLREAAGAAAAAARSTDGGTRVIALERKHDFDLHDRVLGHAVQDMAGSDQRDPGPLLGAECLSVVSTRDEHPGHR